LKTQLFENPTCYVPHSNSHGHAVRICNEHGMPLFRVKNEAQLDHIVNLALRITPRSGHVWVDGRKDNICANLMKHTTKSRYILSMAKCQLVSDFLCEYISKFIIEYINNL
jgi:hypothetical protein